MTREQIKKAAYIVGGTLVLLIVPGGSLLIGGALVGHYLAKKESDESGESERNRGDQQGSDETKD